MESWLTIEEKNVIVQQMTIHHISLIQHNLLRRYMLQRNHTSILAHNCLRTWPYVRTILNKLIELVQVVRRHALRTRQIHRNLQWHTNLRHTQVRIRSNDGTRREFHTLALDIVTDTSFLATQTLLNRLERASTALRRRRHTRNFIVHQRRHMILDNIGHFINYIFICVMLDLLLKRSVILDNVKELVRQIIFRSLIVVLNDRRTYLRRRNAKHRANHPIWTAPETTQTHKVHILIGNTTEKAMDILYLQRLLLLQLLIVRHDARNTLSRELVRLRCTATVLTFLSTTFDIGRKRKNLLPTRLSLTIQ